MIRSAYILVPETICGSMAETAIDAIGAVTSQNLEGDGWPRLAREEVRKWLGTHFQDEKLIKRVNHEIADLAPERVAGWGMAIIDFASRQGGEILLASPSYPAPLLEGWMQGIQELAKEQDRAPIAFADPIAPGPIEADGHGRPVFKGLSIQPRIRLLDSYDVIPLMAVIHPNSIPDRVKIGRKLLSVIPGSHENTENFYSVAWDPDRPDFATLTTTQGTTKSFDFTEPSDDTTFIGELGLVA